MKQKRNNIGQGFLGGVLFCGGALLAIVLFQYRSLNQASALINKYAPIEKIDKILQREFFDQESLQSGQQQMIKEAMKAYINGIWDPYTVYLDSESYSGLQQELEGEGHIEGIWAVVSKKDYYVQVEEVIKGSPAFEAGIEPLDRIIMIWTWETTDLTTNEAVSKIRGEKGTSVILFIERPNDSGKNEYLEKQVVRDIINIPSVKGTVLDYSGHKLWHLEVSIFWDQTNKLMNQAIKDFIDQKVEGIILDLRGNWWGLLETAVDLAQHFLSQGKTIVSTKYHIYEDITYTSKGFGELEKYPTVILIDKLSASASEILTLALKENLNIPVLGTTSFGKGSIQTLMELDNQDSLKYTVGKRYGPAGTSIDKIGIKPDIEVELDLTGYINNKIDNQLEVAKTTLVEKLRK